MNRFQALRKASAPSALRRRSILRQPVSHRLRRRTTVAPAARAPSTASSSILPTAGRISTARSVWFRIHTRASVHTMSSVGRRSGADGGATTTSLACPLGQFLAVSASSTWPIPAAYCRRLLNTARRRTGGLVVRSIWYSGPTGRTSLVIPRLMRARPYWMSECRVGLGSLHGLDQLA